MITIRSKSSIVVLIIIGVASVVFTTPASANDGDSSFGYIDPINTLIL